MMKKTIATLASAALILTNVVVVAAADNTNIVTNTGSNLQLNSSANQTTVVTVTNENNANISQTSISDNNTGNNTEKGNINLCCGTGAGIVTGNAGSQSNMTANVNTSSTGITLPSGTGSSNNNADVTNTGSNFTGNLSANSTTVVTVANQNNMNVAQTDIANNNSGYNRSEKNIGATGIVTGNAVSVSNMNVLGNTNNTVVSGLGGNPCNTCTGNNNLITNTGSGFQLNSSTNDTAVLGVFNENNMWVEQTVLAANNTGYNRSKGNIDPCCGTGSGISTGTAASVANFLVDGNRNTTGVGLDLPMGSNLADVLNTGWNATLNLSANTTAVATASNLNNASAWQSVLTSNSSGNNHVYRNVGGYATFTGNAGAGNNFMVGGNHNTTFLGGAMDLILWLAWL